MRINLFAQFIGLHIQTLENAISGLLTLDDSQQDNDDKEEECDVKEDPVHFIRISCSWIYLITYTSASSYTNIQMEYITLKQSESEQNSQYSSDKEVAEILLDFILRFCDRFPALFSNYKSKLWTS